MTRARVAFYRDFLISNPDIELLPFRSIHLPAGVFRARRSRLSFAMLGDAGPDHIVCNPEDCHLLCEQNFFYPLDEYIFDVLRDKSGRPVDLDGRPLDPRKNELFYRDGTTGKYSVAAPLERRVPVCSEWERLPPLFRASSLRDGRVHSVPILDGSTCLVYRRDIFINAGLPPDSPPPDWDVFIYYAQKLTDRDKPIRGASVQKGQCGFACGTEASNEWLNYLWQAGGDAVHKIKFCPGRHRVAAKKEAELPSKCPLCGKSLLRIRQSWAPAFESGAGLVALRYYHLLRTLRWTRCPRCGEPVNLPAGSDKPTVLACNGPKGCQRLFPYPPVSRIYHGVVRELEPEGIGGQGSGVGGQGSGAGGQRSETRSPIPDPRPPIPDRENFLVKLFERGEVAMLMVSHPYRFVSKLSLPAARIGMMPLPAGWQWVKCPRCGDPIILSNEMKTSGVAVCPRDSTSVNLARAELRGGLSTSLINVKMWGMNFSSPKATRDAVWQLIKHRMEESSAPLRLCVEEYKSRKRRDAETRRDVRGDQEQMLAWKLEQHPASRGAGRLAPWVPGWSDFISADTGELLSKPLGVLASWREKDERTPRNAGSQSRKGAKKGDLRAALREAAAKCAATIHAEKPAAMQERKKGLCAILIPLAILVLLAIRWLYQGTRDCRLPIADCRLPGADRRIRNPRVDEEQGRVDSASLSRAPRGIKREKNAKRRGAKAQRSRKSESRKRHVLAWLLLAPALIALILWVYLPLLRSTQMTFYDWRVVGERRFLGIFNFAAILSSPEFWRIFLQTILFVGLSLALGLAGPILVALLLAEVPRGKQLLRTVFYLPALTSGLAVALLWRLMYDPTETGFLNWLLLHMPRSTYLILPFLLMVAFTALSALFFRRRELIPGAILLILSVGLIFLIPRIQPLERPINWLGNPAAGGIWTMICVILPAAWASAGPGSLIYLAALRSIPVQLYESAELDGAGVFAKIRHITLAELRPLVAINLVGALVGTFQAIRNIFVLTGGQPDGKTKVLALDVWYNAFVFLRFGYATALAWILASMIIGFAVYQLRRLYRERPIADCGLQIAECALRNAGHRSQNPKSEIRNRDRNALRLCHASAWLKNTGVGNAETQRRGGRG